MGRMTGLAKTKRLIASILTLALLASLLCGCGKGDDYPPALPESAEAPPAYGGIQNDGGTFTATLFFLSENERNLFSEERELEYGRGTTRAHAAIEALIDGPQSPVLKRCIPEGLNLEHVELVDEVCNVYLTGVFPQYESDWLVTRAAVAATVEANEGISFVDVFYNGTQTAYAERPLGEATPITVSVDNYLSDIAQTYQYQQFGSYVEASAYESHLATLYLSDTAGKYIVGKSMELTYSSKNDLLDTAVLLTRTLILSDNEGARIFDEGCELYLAPYMQQYVDNKPVPTATPDASQEKEPESTPANAASNTAQQSSSGAPYYEEPPVPQGAETHNILVITLRDTGEADEIRMAAALTLTMTGFLPKIDGVRVIIKDADGSERPLTDTYFVRDDFRMLLGHSVTLACPEAKSGLLTEHKYIVASESVYDPMTRLITLMNVSAAKTGIDWDLTGDDIAGVYVTDGTAVVSFKAGFGKKLAALAENDTDGMKETMLIYSIVNTLCDIPFIKRVWMTEEGERLSGGKLCLDGSLIASPGSVVHHEG